MKLQSKTSGRVDMWGAAPVNFKCRLPVHPKHPVIPVPVSTLLMVLLMTTNICFCRSSLTSRVNRVINYHSTSPSTACDGEAERQLYVFRNQKKCFSKHQVVVLIQRGNAHRHVGERDCKHGNCFPVAAKKLFLFAPNDTKYRR